MKDLNPQKTCKGCKQTTNDFSPKGRKCRKCVSKSNKVTNNKWNPINNQKTKHKNQKKFNLEYNKGVYAFFRGDKIIYIGQSSEIANRLYRHINIDRDWCLNTKTDMSDVTFELICPIKNDAVRKRTEAKLIKLFKPEFNKTSK